MNPTTFDSLKIGDRVHNKTTGRTYRVLEKGRCIVTVGDIACIPASVDAVCWELMSRPEDFSSAPVVRPPRIIMHRQVLDAGGLAIESKDGTKYRIRVRVFDTLESAWDTLPKVTPTGFKTIRCMREELFKIGWIMHTPSGGAEVRWSSPGGNQRIAGTRAAWNYVFGDGGA